MTDPAEATAVRCGARTLQEHENCLPTRFNFSASAYAHYFM